MNTDKNAGYEIIEKLTVGNAIFVLGRMDSQKYGAKYVTWAARKDEPANYFWGHYMDKYEDAREDLFGRAHIESQQRNPNYHKRQAEKLPDICMSTLPSDGSLIVIKHKESGYRVADISSYDADENQYLAEYINKLLDVTPAQKAAMIAGSIHGWNSPAANPTHYDENGKAVKPKSKDRDDAR
jgi:hypothetical protein